MDRLTEVLQERAAMNASWEPDVASAASRFHSRQREVRQRRAVQRAGVAAALLVGAGVAVFPTPRAYAGRCIAACAELVSTGTALSGPHLSLTASDGSTIGLSELRGRVVVVNFWATWCAPCVKEMPWLSEMQRSLDGEGLSIIGVSMDEDGWRTVRPFLAARDIPYPVVLSDPKGIAGFGDIEALPATVVIGRDGRLVSTHQGIIDPAVFRRAIEQELRRRP